jgi:hypothetical protein
MGGEGDDKLKGGAGNDFLDGGAGDNLLDGDQGRNRLINGTEVDFETMVEEFEPLAATLSATEGSGFGDAVYERQTTEEGVLETFLYIVVQAATPSQSLEVRINGDLIGHIETDESGFGELRLSDIPDPEGGFLLPEGFTLAVGDTITIGAELTGVFQAA